MPHLGKIRLLEISSPPKSHHLQQGFTWFKNVYEWDFGNCSLAAAPGSWGVFSVLIRAPGSTLRFNESSKYIKYTHTIIMHSSDYPPILCFSLNTGLAFYSHKIPEIFNFARKKNAYIVTFLATNWKCSILYSYILNILSLWGNSRLKYKVALVILWKIRPKFDKFHRKCSSSS